MLDAQNSLSPRCNGVTLSFPVCQHRVWLYSIYRAGTPIAMNANTALQSHCCTRRAHPQCNEWAHNRVYVWTSKSVSFYIYARQSYNSFVIPLIFHKNWLTEFFLNAPFNVLTFTHEFAMHMITYHQNTRMHKGKQTHRCIYIRHIFIYVSW